MINFHKVSHWQPGSRRKAPIVLDCSLHCGPRDRIGILAAPGSGKSSLARLFCGIDQPDKGDVQITGRVSWPLGFAGFLHPELSVSQNIGTIAKLCGYPADIATEFIANFVQIPNVMTRKSENLSPSERALVAYAISISIPNDYLVCDEVITVGTPMMRKKCDAFLETALRDTGLIFISRSPQQLRKYCEKYCVLIGHHLQPCLDLDAAQTALEIAAGQHKELEPLDV